MSVASGLHGAVRGVAFLLSFALVFVLPEGPARPEGPSDTAAPLVHGPILPPTAHFFENQGQVFGGVRFYSLGEPSVAFRDGGIDIVHRESVIPETASEDGARLLPPGSDPAAGSNGVVIRLHFVGAAKIVPRGRDPLLFRANFFLGNDPGQWQTRVAIYREVFYPELYPGIDLVYRASAEGAKYEFLIRPGARVDDIEIQVEGVDSIAVSDGILLLRASLGGFSDAAPTSWLDDGTPAMCAFVLRSPSSYGFRCEPFDESRTLVIDPLIYSTYLGGSFNEYGGWLGLDSSGEVVTVGYWPSPNFPVTPGAFDTVINGTDLFITKLNATGTGLVYSTFLGGSSVDQHAAVAVDAVGNAYVSGNTYSADFPVTTGAFDGVYNGGGDAFVVKLGPLGDMLLYSTYLGGNDFDEGSGIAVSASGDVHVAGYTISTDFPTTSGAFDRVLNDGYNFPGKAADAFVSELNSTGGSLVFSTYLGGNNSDFGSAIALDSTGNAYVTGGTFSLDFPTTPGALATTYHVPQGYMETFLSKITASGDALVYSTFVGGTRDDVSGSVAVDLEGSAYYTGFTSSTDFPVTAGALGTTYNGNTDGFLLKLTPAGNALNWSTYLGGTSGDHGLSVSLDDQGHLFVAGSTASANFPTTPGAYDTIFGPPSDAFLAGFSAGTGQLLYSTFLGGTTGVWGDSGLTVVADDAGTLYVGGTTGALDFPVTPGAFQTAMGGYVDAFITKITPEFMPVACPRHVTTTWDGLDQVGLRWDAPLDGTPDHYLIYTVSNSAFGGRVFSSFNPAVASASVPYPATSWADPSPITGPEERYYLMRCANAGESILSGTSNAAGVFIGTLSPGSTAISRPLEYFPWMDYSGAELDTVGEYRTAFAASRIEYLEAGTWQRVFGGGDPNTVLEVGKAYVVARANPGRFVFTGLPGAQLLYTDAPGFNPATDARDLQVTVSGDDILLTFPQPPAVTPGVDAYEVLVATSRAGFFDGSALLVGGAPVTAGPGPTMTLTDVGAILRSPELYYLVVPVTAAGVGASTYSVGVWTRTFQGADTLALPLRPTATQSADALADAIPNTLGLLYLSGGVWVPHFRAMPAGVYDAAVVPGGGYQITVVAASRYSFVGS